MNPDRPHHPDRSTIRWHLIDAYLAGPDETHADVYEAATRYVETSSAALELVEWIRRGEMTTAEPPQEPERAFAAMERDLLQSPGSWRPGTAPVPTVTRRRRTGQQPDGARPSSSMAGLSTSAARYSVIGVFVALMVLVLASWLMLRTNRGNGSSVVTTYTTGNAQRANILLPDGSNVILNVASRLDVPADFSRGNRAVRLHGEALFTVIHHDGKPFTVITGNTVARVLGTTFAVQRYDTDTTTTVAVRDGKVAVRSVVLTAQQEMSIGSAGQATIAVADPSVFGFASGVLTLDHVPFKDAVAALDRWYDVDIRVADPKLANDRVHASFTAGSRNDVKTMLQLIFDARVIQDGRTLTIYSK